MSEVEAVRTVGNEENEGADENERSIVDANEPQVLMLILRMTKASADRSDHINVIMYICILSVEVTV